MTTQNATVKTATAKTATAKTATVNTKLVTVTKLGAAIRDANTRIVTLSIMASYYTVIHGDVRFMAGWCKLDAAQITKAVRPLMAVKWAKAKKADKTVQAGTVVDGTYISDKKKRDAICELLQVVPNNHPDKTLAVTTWDEFYSAALAYYTEHKDAAAKADLDSDEENRQFYNRLAGMLEKALEHGVDTHTLAVMVERVKSGKEITRKAKPSKDVTLSAPEPEVVNLKVTEPVRQALLKAGYTTYQSVLDVSVVTLTAAVGSPKIADEVMTLVEKAAASNTK